MLLAGSRALDVYFGTRAAAICDGMEVLLAEPSNGFEAGVAAVHKKLASHVGKRRIRAWLSGGLCRPFILPSLPGVNGAHEILRVATMLANERTGLAGACRVWLDAPRRGEARVAIAVAVQTLDRLQEGVGNRFRVDSIGPWWVDVLRVALLQKAAPVAVGVQDCDSLTVLIGPVGGFEVALTVSPVADDASADSAFTRALISADVAPGPQTFGRLVLGGAMAVRSPGSALGSLLEVSP